MSELPMRGHFRYLRFKTFPMTPRTPQCEVFCPLLSSSKHSGVPEDSKSQLFPSVGLHPHTCPSQGCDILYEWVCKSQAGLGLKLCILLYSYVNLCFSLHKYIFAFYFLFINIMSHHFLIKDFIKYVKKIQFFFKILHITYDST